MAEWSSSSSWIIRVRGSTPVLTISGSLLWIWSKGRLNGRLEFEYYCSETIILGIMALVNRGFSINKHSDDFREVMHFYRQVTQFLILQIDVSTLMQSKLKYLFNPWCTPSKLVVHASVSDSDGVSPPFFPCGFNSARFI